MCKPIFLYQNISSISWFFYVNFFCSFTSFPRTCIYYIIIFGARFSGVFNTTYDDICLLCVCFTILGHMSYYSRQKHVLTFCIRKNTKEAIRSRKYNSFCEAMAIGTHGVFFMNYFLFF